MIFVPIILAILIVVFIVTALTGNFTWDNYDEEKFQNYANERYYEYFGDEEDIEDQLLIVVLTYEDRNEYCYIAWTGDHLESRIDGLLGNEYTELGSLMQTNIASDYKYSLGKNLAQVVEGLTDKIEALELESSFRDECGSDHTGAEGRFVNRTDLSFSSSTLETALDDFAEKTGISVVLLVEENTVVFGTNRTPQIIAIVLLAVIVLVVVLLIRRRRRRRSADPDENYNY